MRLLSLILWLLAANRSRVSGAPRKRRPTYYSGVTPKQAGAKPIPNSTGPAKIEPLPTQPYDDWAATRWVLLPNEGPLRDKIPLLSGFELAAVIENRPSAQRVYGDAAAVTRSDLVAVRTWLERESPWKALAVCDDPSLLHAWPESISHAKPAIYVWGMPGRTSMLGEVAPRPEQMTRLWVRRGLLA